MSVPDLPQPILDALVDAYIAAHMKTFKKIPYSGPCVDDLLTELGVGDGVTYHRVCSWVTDEAARRGVATRVMPPDDQLVCAGCGRVFGSWLALRAHHGRSAGCIDPVEHMVLMRLNQGTTVEDIIAELGCERSAVMLCLARYGQYTQNARTKRQSDDPRKPVAVARYVGGDSVKHICHTFRISTATIYKWLREDGIDPKRATWLEAAT